ncbi:MAG: di-heme-cytochrome C peroxidase [Microvirga sp.]
MKRVFVGIGAVALAVAIGIAAAVLLLPDVVKKLAPNSLIGRILPPALPPARPTTESHWLDQNWTARQRHWFHHATQGTVTFPVPYKWFLALEQPRIELFGAPSLLSDENYLRRFGFITSPKSLEDGKRYGFRIAKAGAEIADPTPPKGVSDNEAGLPVGFARLPASAADPITGHKTEDLLGLTCAACHTGSLNYKSVSMRFDGGPAMVDLGKLEETIGLSIAYTRYVPGRFDRFADRIVGKHAGDDERNALRLQLADVLEDIKQAAVASDHTLSKRGLAHTKEGFGRLDALNRIGNQIFYTNLLVWKDPFSAYTGRDNNFAARQAPVSFPPIWSVSWFRWAQYDASIEQPLVRNAGEALGVSARINMLIRDDLSRPRFQSTIDLNNLHWIERLLKGDDPFKEGKPGFKGLLAPKWPSDLFANDSKWTINDQKIARGRELYKEFCVECHLGPVNDRTFDERYPDASLWKSKHWSHDDASGDRVLNVVQRSVSAMGTDPQQASVLRTREVVVPPELKLDPAEGLKERWRCEGLPPTKGARMPFVLALMEVVDQTIEQWFRANDAPSDLRKELIGPRKNCPNVSREPQYRARPLDGVWATAPYLHNGSVPSLWWLLTPAAERPQRFCMGTNEFDPEHVGFRVSSGGDEACAAGEFLYQTNAGGRAIPGNSAGGHSFEGQETNVRSLPRGVLGRGFSPDERLALIEYLKTL